MNEIRKILKGKRVNEIRNKGEGIRVKKRRDRSIREKERRKKKGK